MQHKCSNCKKILSDQWEKPCPKGCPYKGIYYASEMHYLMGDW